MKEFFTSWHKFVNEFPKKVESFISYPQYLLFVLKFIFVIFVILFNIKKTVIEMGVDISWGILSLIILYIQRDSSCGSAKEQLNGNKKKEKNIKVFFQNPTMFVFLIFFIITIILVALLSATLNNIFIYLVGLIVLILCVFDIIIHFYKFSPFLSIYLFLSSRIVSAIGILLGCYTIVFAVGIDKTIINWTLLLLFLGTTIGSNFFDKNLVKNRFSQDITEENLILRKISFYIGLVFLYIGIYISDRVINSTFYYLGFTSKQSSILNFFQDIIIKTLIFLLVYKVYMGTNKIILYRIFRICYRNKKLKARSSLVQVKLKEGVWRVKDVSSQSLTDLENISIDTFKIKGSDIDTYYVAQQSEISKKINGLTEKDGYPILGVIHRDKSIVISAFATLCILPIISVLDYTVKVDDGIYEVVGKSDKADKIDRIKLSGDGIIYHDKIEDFDTRTQSFEYGTISIRKKGENYIELTINQGRKKDKKVEEYKKIE